MWLPRMSVLTRADGRGEKICTTVVSVWKIIFWQGPCTYVAENVQEIASYANVLFGW